MKIRFLHLVYCTGTVLALATNAHAITVQETGVGSNEVVQIQVSELSPTPVYVYAGVVEMNVNHQAESGFCIDPFHWSSGQAINSYTYASLANGGAIQNKAGIELSALQANTLSRLWSTYHSGAMTDGAMAAGLQIAIWELVAGSNFSLVGGSPDYGASGMLATTQSADYRGGTANLIALRGPVSGQDYVVQAPDGSATAVLLGIAMLSLVALRPRLSVARSVGE